MVNPPGETRVTDCLLDGCLDGLCLLGPRGSYPGTPKLLSQHLGVQHPFTAEFLLCHLLLPSLSDPNSTVSLVSLYLQLTALHH